MRIRQAEGVIVRLVTITDDDYGLSGRALELARQISKSLVATRRPATRSSHSASRAVSSRPARREAWPKRSSDERWPAG